MSLLIKIDLILLLALPFALVLPVGLHFGGVLISIVEVILFLLFVVIYLVYFGRAQLNKILFIPKEVLPIIVFVVLSFFSLLASDNPSSGLMDIMRFIEATIMIILVLKSIKLTRVSPDNIFTVLKYAGVVGSALAVAQLLFGIGTVDQMDKYHDITRSSGLFHGGGFAIIPATGFVLAGISVMRKELQLVSKIFNYAIIVFCLFGLILTLSRTWLLAAFIGIAIYLILTKLKRFFVYTALLPVILMLIFFLLIKSGIIFKLYGNEAVFLLIRYSEISMITTDSIEKTSVGDRFDKWNAAFDIFKKNPFFGVGAQNIDLNIKGARDEIGQKRPDSQWLQILAENGIVAFLLFVYMVIWMAVKGFQVSRLPDKLGLQGRIFMALYGTWLAGAVFWAILYGFIGLYFAFFAAVGINLSSMLTNNKAIESAGLNLELCNG